MAIRTNMHLLWRTGFGPTTESYSDLNALTRQQLWKNIKSNIGSGADPIAASSSFVQDNYEKITDSRLSKRERDDWNGRVRQQSAADLKELNREWVSRMVRSKDQLSEKMAFFWHHHFAIRHPNSFLQQDAVNEIRRHALGNFGDLLRQVSKSGAMILSLNNQQNKKDSPNENFAREIMELFSMGIGNYTETDIKEAARAFTGWSISREGRFVFKREQHDAGVKRVLGQRGKFDGDDIVDIILKQPQTANFIVTKLYRFFVNETVDAKRVELLAAAFRKDYQLLPLLEQIFLSDWFYDEKNMGNRIKTPIELLVGLQRLSPFATIEPQVQVSVQKLLGQVLFHPPSIAGWPVGKAWIDSSTLMVRLQLPQIINGTVSVSLKAKADDDVNMGRETPDDNLRVQGRKVADGNPAWDAWSSQRNATQLAADLLAPGLAKEKLALLEAKTGSDKKEFFYHLMSLPEYQLC